LIPSSLETTGGGWRIAMFVIGKSTISTEDFETIVELKLPEAIPPDF